MKIENQSVVSLNYILRDAAGEILDQNSEGEPLTYLHGASNIISGLEDALEGRQAGDSFKVEIPPKQGYGEKDPALVKQVPKSRFKEAEHLREGVQFEIETPQGTQTYTVTGIEENTVRLDGNHPLAGKTLHFEIEVLHLRQATEEELHHGHVHGAGGHHH